MSLEQLTPTVLIVDDQPDNIQVLAKLLKADCRIKVANSGAKALTLANGEMPPDLILLDVQMPDMDGYEVCQRLKENRRTHDIPVIFVTASNSVTDEEKGFLLGAVDYITKPFYPVIVRARVNTHLSLKRKTDLLEKIAMLDGLTGIPNRRYFDEQLTREFGLARRQGSPLSVILMDVDHFKQFNDHYGHGPGDECLKKVALALTLAAERPTDVIARYGGEEFVALLPGTDAAGACRVAERLREAVQALALPHAHSSAAEVVTLSLGVAVLPASTDTPRDDQACMTSLLAQADAALYAAKQAGRNCYRLASEST
ncbi:diguanylate cyclase domain-containing protein [Vreelandella massiliensis]|uniref:diguanylate cyclase domain-containing protein n=1 Tax=Vreelandella massiliensis TaxID=1816686 RepID=UPI00096A9962|nr:diguanylate cyclase [Halomonas massiliensis]